MMAGESVLKALSKAGAYRSDAAALGTVGAEELLGVIVYAARAINEVHKSGLSYRAISWTDLGWLQDKSMGITVLRNPKKIGAATFDPGQDWFFLGAMALDLWMTGAGSIASMSEPFADIVMGLLTAGWDYDTILERLKGKETTHPAVISDQDAKAILSILKSNGNSGIGYRLAVQKLNPAADICLNIDTGSEYYVSDGLGLGVLLNNCWNILYSSFNGDADKMASGWEESPYSDVYTPELVSLIADSFKPAAPWEKTYLHRYLASHSDRYAEHDSYIGICRDYEANDVKYGPYNEKIAMLKAAAGLMGQVPVYYIPSLDNYITEGIDGLDKVDGNVLKERMMNGSMDAWLAVLCQENPEASFEEKYEWEKSCAIYTQLCGNLWPDFTPFTRYKEARNQVRHIKKVPLWKGDSWRIVGIILGILPALFSLGVLIAALFGSPLLEDFSALKINGKTGVVQFVIPICSLIFINLMAIFYLGVVWGTIKTIIIFDIALYVLNLLAAKFFGKYMLIIMLVVALFFVVLNIIRCYRPIAGEKALRLTRHPRFEHLVIEPLHYAWKETGRYFDSSLTGNLMRDEFDYRVKVKGLRGRVILLVVNALLLLLTVCTNKTTSPIIQNMFNIQEQVDENM